jgi:hypothetical protein
MKAITKRNTVSILSIFAIFTLILAACGQGTETKKEEVTEPVVAPAPAPAPAPATDTMPKLDTTASTRPDPIKTK